MADMKFDPDAVRELAALLDETGLTEIEISEGERRIRVVRGSLAPASAPPPVLQMVPETASAPEAKAAFDASHPGAVTSPMVGIVYMAPEPESEPYVKIGDEVTEGQTLMIIEAMKTMNPIRSPRSGTVRQILAANADPVEYGEALMIIT